MEAVKKEFELENATAKMLAEAAASVLIEKKALDVRLYCVGEENPITDYYINVTGRSNTQVGALCDDLVDKLSECGRDAVRVEGRRGDSWILVDYADVIVNVFDREAREFYNLDRLMPAGTEVDISDIISRVDKKLEIKNAED